MSTIGSGGEKASAVARRVVAGLVKDVVTSKDRTMDFALIVDVATQDERALSEHAVLVRTDDGRGLADMRSAYLGKYVWAAVDALGRSAAGLPARGRPRWSELRNARISPAGAAETVRVRISGAGGSETVYVLDDEARKAYTLRLPPRGWRCSLMTFVGGDGVERRVLFTAEAEK